MAEKRKEIPTKRIISLLLALFLLLGAAFAEEDGGAEDGNITNWVLAGGRWISDEDESALDDLSEEDFWIRLEADDICELPTEGLF